jgi:hypothetical protein
MPVRAAGELGNAGGGRGAIAPNYVYRSSEYLLIGQDSPRIILKKASEGAVGHICVGGVFAELLLAGLKVVGELLRQIALRTGIEDKFGGGGMGGGNSHGQRQSSRMGNR